MALEVENTVIGAFLKGRRNSTPIKTREPVLVKELYELEDEERKSIEVCVWFPLWVAIR